MQVDHATFVCRHIDGLKTFFGAVAGLKEGPRPPFRSAGAWFYTGDRPVIHLLERGIAESDERPGQALDHIAFRIESCSEWSTLLDRLRDHDVRYAVNDIPMTRERQLFAEAAPGVLIEFVTAWPLGDAP